MTESEYDNLKLQIRESIFEKMNYTMELEDSMVWELLEDEIMSLSRNQYIPLKQKKRLLKELYHSVRKYDVLQDLIEDSSITEIMVNGKDDIFIERNGRISRSEHVFESTEKLLDVIEKIVARANRIVNESTPIVDARLENGSRVHVVLYPIALNGPILTIRRFPDKPITIDDLLAYGSITKEAVDFLKKLVIAGYNIIVSGGTGSGKTTFLNVLSSFIPSNERVITIEDSAELQLQNIENLVRMETRNANIEGCQAITIRDLIKASLRMRPDRILVGEVRGAEAVDMIQALNTGHSGSLSTGHANSAKDMLARLEMMILMGMDLPISAIRRQIAGGVDLIVHLGRLRDKSRRVLSIVEILGLEQDEIQIQTLFEFQEEMGADVSRVYGCLKKIHDLTDTSKLSMAGLIP